MNNPSEEQLVVRNFFKACSDCFNGQPQTGGAEPSGPGPFSREWWYTTSLGSGLFYYNYFMQQTLDSYLNLCVAPVWCQFDVDLRVDWVQNRDDMCSDGAAGFECNAENVGDPSEFSLTYLKLWSPTDTTFWSKIKAFYLYVYCDSTFHAGDGVVGAHLLSQPINHLCVWAMRSQSNESPMGSVVIPSTGWYTINITQYATLLKDPGFPNYGMALRVSGLAPGDKAAYTFLGTDDWPFRPYAIAIL